MTHTVSTRRVWLLTCRRCGDNVTLTWPDNDDLDLARWQQYIEEWSTVHDRNGTVTITAAVATEPPPSWPYGLPVARCRPCG